MYNVEQRRGDSGGIALGAGDPLMPRMMDSIRTRGLSVPGSLIVPPAWVESVRAAPVFVADEAVAWYHEREQEHWKVSRDFPVLAPPYPTFFVEGRAPSHMWCQDFGREPWPRQWPTSMGWLVNATRMTAEDREAGASDVFWAAEMGGPRSPDEVIGPAAEDPAWFVRVDLLLALRDHERVRGPLIRWCFELDEAGGMIHNPTGEARLVSKDLAGLEEMTFDAMARGWLDPLLTMLTFLHCKNVETRVVTPPPKLSRAHERRHGQPLTRYHVLDVHPVGRPAGGGAGGNGHNGQGSGMAIHTVRGGFRTYTAEGPLFGRHVGTWFWADQRWVGDERRGRVRKDYQVRAPRRSA